MGEVWRNWAGDQQCSPARVERPGTRDELASIVARAAADGSTLRAVGAGHSFTDIACTDGVMLRLDRLDRVLDADPASGLVRVEGGIWLHELNRRLHERGLAFENLGDIDRQSIAGAISTGTHGTGTRFLNISAQLHAVELVRPDGSFLELTEDSDPDAFRAARVGLGALGIVSAITARCVPAFTLHRVDRPRPLGEILDGLDAIPDEHDHFEFYVFPHTDVALCRETTRTDEPPRRTPGWREYLQEEVLENRVVDLFARFGRRFPRTIPRLAAFVAGRLGKSVKVDASHRVFASRRNVRFTEMEYAIPREHSAEVIRRVLEVIERRRFAVSFPIEVRFVAPDDAHLSTSHGRDTCYIAVHMYRGMEWYPYFRAVEAIMDSYEGRPHWGKRHFQSAATLAGRYPEWDAFQEVRARLDPDGVFANEYTDRVLGRAAAAVEA